MADDKTAPVLSDKEKKVQTKLIELYARKCQFRVQHGVSHTSRNVTKSRDDCVDLSKFTAIVGFSSTLTKDGLPETITVESNVTMDGLVKASVARGVIPPVIMECPKISVGGGFCGHSGESSSFRYGLFSDNVRSIQGFYPDGRAFHLFSDRPEDREDFYAISNTYGTIAIVTRLELKVRKAEPFVKLTYKRIGAVEEGVQLFEEAYGDQSIDYIEGTMFSKTSGIIATGYLTSPKAVEAEGLKEQTFTKAADPWYYIHLNRKLDANDLTSEAIPLEDYLFRYDRGGFWMGRNGFEYFGVPFNDWTRWFLDPFMKTHVCLKAFQKAKLNHQFFIQDMGVPPAQAGAFISWIDENWGRYPILLWPLWLSAESLLLRKGKSGSEKVVNFGVYGDGPVSGEDIRSFGGRTEDTLQALGGFKGGYAIDYGKEGYYEEFDEERFRKIRAKRNAEHLPTPFEKFKKSSITEQPILWPFAGLYGVAYVLAEKATRWWYQ